jgi:hypothetical protein
MCAYNTPLNLFRVFQKHPVFYTVVLVVEIQKLKKVFLGATRLNYAINFERMKLVCSDCTQNAAECRKGWFATDQELSAWAPSVNKQKSSDYQPYVSPIFISFRKESRLKIAFIFYIFSNRFALL